MKIRIKQFVFFLILMDVVKLYAFDNRPDYFSITTEKLKKRREYYSIDQNYLEMTNLSQVHAMVMHCPRTKNMDSRSQASRFTLAPEVASKQMEVYLRQLVGDKPNITVACTDPTTKRPLGCTQKDFVDLLSVIPTPIPSRPRGFDVVVSDCFFPGFSDFEENSSLDQLLQRVAKSSLIWIQNPGELAGRFAEIYEGKPSPVNDETFYRWEFPLKVYGRNVPLTLTLNWNEWQRLADGGQILRKYDLSLHRKSDSTCLVSTNRAMGSCEKYEEPVETTNERDLPLLVAGVDRVLASQFLPLRKLSYITHPRNEDLEYDENKNTFENLVVRVSRRGSNYAEADGETSNLFLYAETGQGSIKRTRDAQDSTMQSVVELRNLKGVSQSPRVAPASNPWVLTYSQASAGTDEQHSSLTYYNRNGARSNSPHLSFNGGNVVFSNGQSGRTSTMMGVELGALAIFATAAAYPKKVSTSDFAKIVERFESHGDPHNLENDKIRESRSTLRLPFASPSQLKKLVLEQIDNESVAR